MQKTNSATGSLAHLYRWDEIEGWRMLVQHFDLADGFSFIVVLAPDDEAIALVRDHLATLFPDSHAVRRIRFNPAEDPASLAEAVLAIASESPAVSVVWIDADPGSAEQFEVREKTWASALGTLNRYRNSVTTRLKTTLALALPTRLQPALRKAAPDLWSIRSGVFRIEPPGASRAALRRLPEGEWRLVDDDHRPGGDPAVTLAEADKLRGKPGRELLLATLLQRAGNQACQRFDWPVALASLQEAYSLQEAAGADPGLRWDIATDLAKAFLDIARFDRAEFYLNRALQTAEEHFGGEDPKTALTLNNLAALLRATNRLAEAEPLMRRALAIDEQSYGAEHPKVAIRLNNLATLLTDTSRLMEAEPLMRRALAIDEQSFGAEHPDVARDLNNLAQLLQATNRLPEAEPLMRRTLAIDELCYGAEHPAVARDLNNLAQLLQATNRLPEAEPLMRRALSIDEQAYGGEHPDVAIDLNNLAQLLQATNRLPEAEPLMRRALAIDEQAYGAQHPKVAICLNNLAALLKDTNRLVEAEPLMRRALAIDEQSFGAQHPKVAIRLNNLARLLQDTNRLSEAEPLARRAVEIFQKSLGDQHPKTITARKNHAAIVAEMED